MHPYTVCGKEPISQWPKIGGGGLLNHGMRDAPLYGLGLIADAEGKGKCAVW
jgi:hypothetical protein